jgi:hypothetical protein
MPSKEILTDLERAARALADAGHLQGEALYRQLGQLVADLLSVEICIILRYEPAHEQGGECLVGQVLAAGLPEEA